MRIRSAITAAGAIFGFAGLVLCALVCAPSAQAQQSAGIPGFTGSWLESALESQYDLGNDLAFKNAPLLGTHNSFNSQEEMGPDLSLLAINQREDLATQLQFGIRALELDLHPDPNAGVPGRPVVCHTLPKEGCVVVKEIDPFLTEISDFLQQPENSDQVVLLYLEDDLDSADLHSQAAQALRDGLGKLIYKPDAAGSTGSDTCEEIPGDLTRDQVLDSGAQVVIVSGCGTGRAWHSLTFSWDRHLESRPHGFADYPDCGPDYTKQQYNSSLVRYYEDSTRSAGSGGADDGLFPDTVAAMERCGVDLLSFDRIEPLDGRLAASIWSWADDEPSTGRCAVMRTGRALLFGRWISKPCGVQAPPACRNRSKWTVGKVRLSIDAAARWCTRHGAKLAVPRTGFENQRLRRAMDRRGTHSALLGYRLIHGLWTPLDSRDG